MNAAHGHPIRVGIAGLGRSGWGIHMKALGELKDRYRIVAVSDPDVTRREEAASRFDCRTHDTFESLVADDGVELVVVATPNPLHVQHTVAAAKASRHVVCEKPVASSTQQVHRLMTVAQASRQVIAPFQNCRYEAMYRKMIEVITSGVLGRIIEIRVCAHSFNRRWDWQTLREFEGGLLRNIGSHFIDQLLVFFGDTEPKIFCRMDRALWSGDTEDHVKLIMHAKDAPLIDLELSSACAHPQPKWLIMGTCGGLQSDGNSLNWRYVDFSELPERPVDRRPTSDRTYNNEHLSWQDQVWTLPADADMGQANRLFYEDLSRVIRNGAPLTVTLESVARQITIIEECHTTSGFYAIEPSLVALQA